MDIVYNGSMFRMNRVSEGNLFNQNGATTLFSGGRIDNTIGNVKNIFNVIIDNKNVSSDGEFIIVNMTATGPGGSSWINLSNIKISDPDALPVSVDSPNGSRINSLSATLITILPPASNYSLPTAGAPVAKCGNDKLRCENAGMKVQFNGTASYDTDGTIISYDWEFGDGTIGTGVAPNHTYASYRWNGSAYQPYRVNLTVTDNSGLKNRTSQNVIIWMAGDANGDGKVNILDASVIGLKWNGNDPCADLNNDGIVNILDNSIIGLNWGKSAIIGS